MKTVTVLVGSLRKESINAKFARALETLAEGKLAFKFVSLADLPMYNDDLWADVPAAVTAFKDEIWAAEALLFVTPEYNRSIPPVLSNAIAWGSKPMGKNAFAGKPAAVVGTSPGAIGTAVAQSHLRYMLTVIDTIVMGQPEIYFQSKPGLIADDHTVTDDNTKAFLTKFVDTFAAFVDQVSKPA